MAELKSARFETVVPKNGRAYTIMEFPSTSNPAKTYRVDLVNARCDCPAWKFQRGGRKMCKHLRSLGFVDMIADAAKAAPVTNYSEAL